MRRRIRLQPDRMTDLQLWSYLAAAIKSLDPLDLSYTPGQAHHVSLNALDALSELRVRGIQLALDLPETNHRADQIA